jgi:ribosomal-protein-alanine N-acetyltransferase
MAVTVTKADIADLEALYNIEKECFTCEAFSKRQVASLLKSPNALNLMAKLDGEVVGFISVLTYKRKKHRVAHIYTLDVAAKARKKGIGLKLLEASEQILKRSGVEECLLEVRVDNVAARELYRKFGYVEGELLKAFYPSVDGIRMKKRLQ